MKDNKQSKPRSNRYYNSEMIAKMTSLGCAFNTSLLKNPVDPEKLILESLRFYWDYNDIFFMIYSLLKKRISHLIHVERLVNLAQASFMSSDEKVLLIALCDKLAENGDRRFKLVEKKLCKNKKELKMNSPPKNECSSYLIKKWGKETSLLPFGVKVRSFYEISEKKFFSLEKICKNNAWMKLRILIGPNYRADILYFKGSGLAKTAYQAGKLAGCNISTATRIWKTLQPIPHLNKLIA